MLQIDKIYCENRDTEEAKITICYKQTKEQYKFINTITEDKQDTS